MPRKQHVSLRVFLGANAAWLLLLAAVLFWRNTFSEPGGARSAMQGAAAGGPTSLLSAPGSLNGDDADSLGVSASATTTSTLAPEAMGQAFASALDIKDPVERMAAFSALLRDLNPENLPQALAAIENAPREPGDDALLVNFMRSWIRIDPTAAMDYALDNAENRKFYVENSDDKLIREWAMRDPTAAMAYLDTVPPDHKMNRRSLHTNFVMGMAENDLTGAAAYAEENQYGRERGQSIDFLARRFMEKGGESALREWLDTIDAGGENRLDSYKEHAISQATREISRNDPEAAKALVESYLGTDLVDGRALRAAADGISKTDPAQAVDWLMEVSEGGDRSYAVAETIEDWADKDPNAAGTWLGQQELTPEMDPAVSAFAREITRDDPESALAWSSIISDDRRRTETMARVGRDWFRRDKAAATQWVEQNEIDPDVRRYFERLMN